MRNKEEKVEVLAQSLIFGIAGVSDTWWDEYCVWSALLDGSGSSGGMGRA